MELLRVIFVLVLLCFCLVNGQQGNCEQNGGIIDNYIKSEVKRQLELMNAEVIKAEVEKQVKVELKKLVKEGVENELEDVREGNHIQKCVCVVLYSDLHFCFIFI